MLDSHLLEGDSFSLTDVLTVVLTHNSHKVTPSCTAPLQRIKMLLKM